MPAETTAILSAFKTEMETISTSDYQYGQPGLEGLTQLSDIACSQEPVELAPCQEVYGCSQEAQTVKSSDFITPSQDETPALVRAVPCHYAAHDVDIEVNLQRAQRINPVNNTRESEFRKFSQCCPRKGAVDTAPYDALTTEGTSAHLHSGDLQAIAATAQRSVRMFIPENMSIEPKLAVEPTVEPRTSRAGRRGPMDEMRQLVRILCRMLPDSLSYLDLSEGEGGGNRTSEDQIKNYLHSTLGNAPLPKWGVPDGWGTYLSGEGSKTIRFLG